MLWKLVGVTLATPLMICLVIAAIGLTKFLVVLGVLFVMGCVFLFIRSDA